MTDSSNSGAASRFSLLVLGISLATGLSAQIKPSASPRANYVIVPQSRAFAYQKRAQPVRIESVRARIKILGQAAVTRLEVVVHNPSRRQEEAVLLLPVPEGAAVSGFTFAGSASSSRARLLPKEEARQTYSRIVQRLKDPALLEFAGMGLVRSSVFPVPAGGRQRISMSFESVLPVDGNRIDYILPRTASLEARVPWDVEFDVRDDQPISMIYSPSHVLKTTRISAKRLRVQIQRAAARDPGPVRLSFLRAGTGKVSASIFTYPDPKIGGGYFLLLANLPKASGTRRTVPREVTLVLDRSGSVAGPKLDQLKAAALQVIEGLADGERFNIIDYSTQVASFGQHGVKKSRMSVVAARQYLQGLRPNGGTNIYDALVRAMEPVPQKGTLPIVLFLTDGVPTVRITNENTIRELVRTQNRYQRRIFTFGVGHDVNVPLLDAVADVARGTATYVKPDEDVELAVARVFRKLAGPVLEAPVLSAIDAEGQVDTRRLRARQPSLLSDVYADEQIVVLGQYRGSKPLRLRLSGRYLGQQRSFELKFSLQNATTRNGFVPRLWAARQIAYLVDQVRAAGASVGQLPVQGADPFRDPRLREIREEILRLSTEYGVLSEYTAFLATEGSYKRSWADLQKVVGGELDTKAMKRRSGAWAVNQSVNFWNEKNRAVGNPRNVWVNDSFERVETINVQQIHDRAFFKRRRGWVDGRLLNQASPKAARVVRLGSPEYGQLLEQLTRQGRPGVLSLRGEIVVRVGGEVIRVINP